MLQVLASAILRRHTSRAIAVWHQFQILRVVTFSVTGLAQRWRGRSFLRLSLAQIRRLYELVWSYPYVLHDPAIAVF